MTFSLDLNQQPNTYFLNLHGIRDSQRYPSFVRLLAARLIDHPTMSVAYFFTEFLSDQDFEILADANNTVFDKLNDKSFSTAEYIPEYEMILLVSWMLAVAESSIDSVNVDSDDSSDVMNSVCRAFMTLIACVSLEKKGLVEILWENVTLGSGMDHKPMVRRLK